MVCLLIVMKLAFNDFVVGE